MPAARPPLQVGDRHLDNLMLRSSGEIFHIDFGFMFGHDPKPFPPAMKITEQMVMGMGGPDGVYFKEFKLYLTQAR